MLASTGKIVHFLNAAMRAKLVEYRAARPAWLGFFNLWPRSLANALHARYRMFRPY